MPAAAVFPYAKAGFGRADMRAGANAKNTDAPAHIGSGCDWREQDERE